MEQRTCNAPCPTNLSKFRSYGWAFVNPGRKLWYKLTITAASIPVTVIIGTIELPGLLGNQLSLREP